MMKDVTITSEGKYRIYTTVGTFETDFERSINRIIDEVEYNLNVLSIQKYNDRYISTKEKLAEDTDKNLCAGYIKNDDYLDGKALRRIRRKNKRKK